MGVLGDAAAGAAIGSGISPGLGTLLGGAAGAIGSIGSSLLGLKSQKDTNKAQMKLAEYEWQKNLEMWNLQNEYNSPIRQVERIRQAGLNPNLVYGGNSVGNSSGEAPRYTAPQLKAYTDFSGVGNAATTAMNVALAYRDMDMKDEQKRLLSNQADAMHVESLKKMQETVNEFWKGKKSQFDYNLAANLRRTTMEVAQANLNKMKQDIAESKQRESESKSRTELNNLEIEIKRATGMDMANASIQNLRAAARLSYLNGTVITWENELRDQGINPKDPAAYRIAEVLFGNLADKLEEGANNLSDWTQRKFGFRVFKKTNPGESKKYIFHGTR